MIDGTLIKARAWMKSFGPKDGLHDQLEERELTLLMREMGCVAEQRITEVFPSKNFFRAIDSGPTLCSTLGLLEAKSSMQNARQRRAWRPVATKEG